MIIGFAVILAILLVFYGIARYLVYFILDRNAKYKESPDSLSKDPEEAKRGILMLCGRDDWKQEFAEKRQAWSIQSFDGLTLKGYFLENPSTNYVILCHGFTGKHSEMVGRAEYFYRKGYCVLLPDARAHGESEGRYRGMGWLERNDLKLWIEEIIAKEADAKIVLFGQSMGAATVMNTAAEELPAQVKLVIQDCGYTSVWDEFAGQLKVRYHLPAFPVMHIADQICKRKAGYTFREAAPLRQIGKCKLPILMIHGAEDDFVPCRFVEELFQAANEPKEKLVVKNAGHCMSMVVDTERYWNTVDAFIAKYL